MKFVVLFFLHFLFWIPALNATNYYTSQDGNWNTNSRWVSNNKPGNWWGAGDTVFVEHDIVLNQNVGFAGVLVIESGASLIGTRNIQGNSNSVIVNHGDLQPRNISLNSNTRMINNGTIETSGNLSVYSNADLISNGDFSINGNFTNYGDTVTFANPLTVTGNIENGAVLIAADSISANGNITNNSGNLISETYLSTGNDFTNNSGTVTSNGNMMVTRNKTNNGSGSIYFDTGTQLNVGNNFTNNNDVNINGDVYVDNNLTNNGGTSFTIGASSIVEVNNSLTNNGNDFTVNGGLVVGSGGVNNGGGNFDGSGLFQIDGGFTNWGTIGGNLDVCSSDASSNPITSGNGVSGGATVCSNSGVNFPINAPAPLPVELLSLKATQNDDFIELVWVTASELNNDYFTIERSEKGTHFIELDYVTGNGTTNESSTYKYVDGNPIKGQNFYRLKQTDFDGKSKNIGTVSVFLESSAELDVSLYPNPTTGEDAIYLKIPSSDSSENFTILINDLLGKDYVSDLTFINQGDFTLVILDFSSKLPRGTYLVNAVIGGKLIQKKLVVQ